MPSRFHPVLPVPRVLAAELESRGASGRGGASGDRVGGHGGTSSTRTIERRILVLPDQLSLEIGPIAGAAAAGTEVVLIESGEWLSRRPYHKQRIAWILLSQRSFAIELADAGFAVRIVRGDLPMVDLLRRFLEDLGDTAPLEAMEPAERESRVEFAPLVADGRLLFTPHDGFLTSRDDLERSRTSEGWRMDRFYQAVRRRTGILMEGGKPIGGKFSFDAENRKRWDGTPAAPTPLSFPGSLLREEVVEEIETRFARHPGVLDVGTIPATRAEVERMWQWARKQCLPNFGPYEDAMSRASRGIFHTRISPLMNLHRLLPSRVVEDIAGMELPLSSKEGFIRQVLGWREFVYQVHRETDGFRSIAGPGEAPLATPGDGGYARWSGESWKPRSEPPAGIDGGARPNRLRADLPVPTAWWGRKSGLSCLDHVVGDVWEEGWSHHITRLMVLSNIATLLAVEPRDLCDWFWVAYIDSWDWVVEPNVLGMSTYGFDGMTTKPYVSGSAYLEKMGDSCRTCAFTPGKDCPIGGLYWSFLARNEAALCDNPRMKLPLASMRGRDGAKREADSAAFVSLRAVMLRGEPLRPAPLARPGQVLFGTTGEGPGR